tara:strand:- start:540 stop:1373 length:834 start_codon:yes stop_codon:yes gene_type:complete
MTKLKHNKKRNTAFLYETLVRELTKSIVKKNNERKEKLMETIKEFFSKDKLLAKELELYKSLCETYSMEPHVAEKLIFEIRKQHGNLDKKKIFNEQSSLIKKMNQIISKNAFSSFVPNYKSLATVYQIFNQDTPTKERVLLENKMLKAMTTKAKEIIQEMKPIDDITFKTFAEKFNTEYSSHLISEQKDLLTKYISSFVDNGVELKIFLNEELGRLKKVVTESMTMEEIKADEEMSDKTKKVLEIIDDFRNHKIGKELIEKVLKIQNLVREIETDVN